MTLKMILEIIILVVMIFFGLASLISMAVIFIISEEVRKWHK